MRATAIQPETVRGKRLYWSWKAPMGSGQLRILFISFHWKTSTSLTQIHGFSRNYNGWSQDTTLQVSMSLTSRATNLHLQLFSNVWYSIKVLSKCTFFNRMGIKKQNEHLQRDSNPQSSAYRRPTRSSIYYATEAGVDSTKGRLFKRSLT